MKNNFCLSIAFFLSGFSALLFQVAWQRLLTINYGIGCDSITTIVSIYMFGLGIGGFAGGILSKRLKNPLLSYICAESVIGLIGLASPFLLLSTSFPGAFIFAFLIVPTFLMGLTLPLLVEYMARIKSDFLNSVSMLYSANTLGAGFGAIIGAYGIISLGGLDTAIYFASGINFTLALFVFLFLSQSKDANITQRVLVESSQQLQSRNKLELGKTAYLCAFLAGFLAIAFEIVWFRTNELLVKASPYAFATTLGLYLFGLATGSFMLNKLSVKKKIDGKKTFYMLQSLICCYVLLSYFCLYLARETVFVPLINQSFSVILHPPVELKINSFLSAFGAFDFILWPAYFLLIPTILMGACFPLISYLARQEGVNESEAVGVTYFFSIMGNVAGGIVTGLIFLDVFGIAYTVLLLSVLSLPFVILWILAFSKKGMRVALTVSLLVFTCILCNQFPSSSKFAQVLHVPPDKDCQVFVQEGKDATVVTYEKNGMVWNYINGLPHGGRLNYTHGYYARAIEGLVYSGKAERILVIGYGTGAIVEAILKCSEVKEVTIVELSKSVMQNLNKMPMFQRLLKDSRIRIVIEDGRRYLNKTDTKYDAIMMDPVRSTTAYSNNIYSAEFFRLAKAHLNPRGTIMVWLDNQMELPLTIISVFDQARLYWACCVASSEPLVENEARRKQLMQAFSPDDQSAIKKSEGYSCDRAFIEHYTQGHGIIRDLKPRTEYYLGLLWGKPKSAVSQY